MNNTVYCRYFFTLLFGELYSGVEEGTVYDYILAGKPAPGKTNMKQLQVLYYSCRAILIILYGTDVNIIKQVSRSRFAYIFKRN